MSLEMAHKVIVPQKKIMSRSFLNSGTLIVILAYRGLSEEEGTSQELQHLFQLHDIFLFTCLQATVRRGGNKSGAPAAVPASQCLYFLLVTGNCQKRREQVRSSSSSFSFTMYLFLLAYRGLSEEEGTSQELQQQFQLHNVFINHKLSTLKVGRRFQAF
jgi:hypothetical protein